MIQPKFYRNDKKVEIKVSCSDEEDSHEGRRPEWDCQAWTKKVERSTLAVLGGRRCNKEQHDEGWKNHRNLKKH